MDDTAQRKGKILDFLWEGMWTDGLGLLFTYWRSWFIGSAFFLIAFLVLGYLSEQFPDGLIWGFLNLALEYFLIYFFCVCFLNQEPVTGKVRPSLRQCLQVFVCLALVSAVLAAFEVFIPMLFGYLNTLFLTPATAYLAFLSFPLSELLVFWLVMRMLLIAPLGVNEIKQPLLKSWQLTKGKTGRILPNFVMLVLMITPVFLIDKVGVPGAGKLLQVFATGIYSAYSCVACKIFYGENIAAHLAHDRRAVQRAS